MQTAKRSAASRLAWMVPLLWCVGLGARGGVLSAEQKREADAAIEQHRKGTLVIEAPAGAEVKVEQVGHAFWFGAALANQAFETRMPAEEREKYLKTFLENFNSAVTENALKWGQMESRRGRVNYSTVDAMLAWTDQHGIPLRGHNIYWGIPNFVQPWVKELSNEELEAVLKARGHDVGRRYKGRFAEYDLNNEMVHGNFYEQRLGKDITLKMTQWVREEDPQAKFYLNDYDMLTGRRVDDYVKQIKGFLEQGVPLAGIGVQGHSHGDSFDPAVTKASLDKLAQFGLPIRVTEFNMPGQNSRFYKDPKLKMTEQEEQARAEAIVDYYRLCFAHPQVEGILMWGFWEGANWIPASSLYKRDWTPTPAAKAYKELVYGKWWTRWQGKADEKGRCTVRAFYGKHRVTVGGREQVVELKKGEGEKVVRVGK